MRLRDANGRSIACAYARQNEQVARQAKALTMDEARRVAGEHCAAAGVAWHQERRTDAGAASVGANAPWVGRFVVRWSPRGVPIARPSFE